MTQGLPLPGKFGHPNAAIVYAVAKVDLSDDHLGAVGPLLRAVTACTKSIA